MPENIAETLTLNARVQRLPKAVLWKMGRDAIVVRECCLKSVLNVQGWWLRGMFNHCNRYDESE